MTKTAAAEREAKRAEMNMVNELLQSVGQKMFARENECHALGIRYFDDANWLVYKREHDSLMSRKFQ